MRTPRVVILAAGRGGRLAPLTDSVPKSLLPIGGVPVLLRAVDAFASRGLSDVRVVVGHREDEIRAALAGRRVSFVRNPDYAEDVNVRSLALGLGQDDQPALVVEGDVVFDDSCADAFVASTRDVASVWFTYGRFRESQLGGILKCDESGTVTDLRFEPRFAAAWASYRKLLGVVWIGPHEVSAFRTILQRDAAENLRQYYMMSWVRNLSVLPCRAIDLEPHRAGSFNTHAEYLECGRRLSPG